MPNKSSSHMKIPKYIEFPHKCYHILRASLRASETEENCAILIGEKKASIQDKEKHYWVSKHIWQCRNIWGQENSRLKEQPKFKSHHHKKIHLSKEFRFEIDPKDQIEAQKWARKNNLEVLCFAHSHPSDRNIPSEIDLFWHHSPGLMVISDKFGDLNAWWIENKENFHQVKIKVFYLR